MSTKFERGARVESRKNPGVLYRVLQSGPRRTKVTVINAVTYGPEFTVPTSTFRHARGGAK